MAYSSITRPSWLHQDKAVAWGRDQLASNQYALWLMGCAVGKTQSALTIATEYHNVLVLTVKGAISNAWESDIKAATDGMRFIAPTGTVKERLAEIQRRLAEPFEGTNVVCLNYEAAYIIRNELARLSFGLVISDEAHKLKSHNSKTSQALAWALKFIPHHLSMTGTAFNDRPTDLYGIFRFLEPVKFPHPKALLGAKLFGQWGNFFERYAIYYMMDKIKIATSYKNLEELSALVDPHTFYLNTEDVFSHRNSDAPVVLPELRHIDIPVAMTPEMKRAYKQMCDDMVSTFGDQLMTADCTLAQATRLHQLTSGVWTDTYDDNKDNWTRHYIKGNNPKVDATLELVDQIGHAPFVVFTNYKSDVEVLEKALDKEGVSHLKLVGGTYEHDRWAAGEAQALLVNMSAGSSGVNLQRADYGIYFSTGHSATDYDQSTWRIRRPTGNLDTPKTLYHLMVEDSIDEEIRVALDNKGDIAGQLLKELKKRL